MEEGDEKRYREVIFCNERTDKEREENLMELGKLLVSKGKGEELVALTKEIRPLFDGISKAKTAKIVRNLIDMLCLVPGKERLGIDLCKDCIDWAIETKRSFLRQRVEARLGSLYLANNQFHAALDLISKLNKEVKKLDDKLLLVDIQLIESRIHLQLRNIPKSKAALTSARTSANAIYCPPSLQAQLDMQSGTLHAEERDYKTAYSYFFECFEGLSSLENSGACKALKYMLLCKIMINQTSDLDTLLSGQVAITYAGKDIDAMRAIANAHNSRSLLDFEKALQDYHVELKEDQIINHHLSSLYDTLLEQNLSRIVEPFSCVELSHVAELIDLPLPDVEAKLSKMILDKQLSGVLDQGEGHLVLFDEIPKDETFEATISTIENTSRVVDSLYVRANKLS